MRLIKLSEHCYCLIGLCHSDYFSDNAGFIVGENEAIIIDSGFNLESAQTIFHYTKAVTPKNEISKLINLEYHYDHIYGNVQLWNKWIKTLEIIENLEAKILVT